MSASIAVMKQLQLILLLLYCLVTVSCGGFAPRQQVLDTELIEAIKAADKDAMNTALKKGANPDAETGDKGTALGTLLKQYKRSLIDHLLTFAHLLIKKFANHPLMKHILNKLIID